VCGLEEFRSHIIAAIQESESVNAKHQYQHQHQHQWNSNGGGGSDDSKSDTIIVGTVPIPKQPIDRFITITAVTYKAGKEEIPNFYATLNQGTKKR
jgi:hypothetical protein